MQHSHFKFLLPCVLACMSACTSFRSTLVTAASNFEPKTPGAAPESFQPTYTDRDAKRAKIAVKLTLVASGLKGPTDFVPIPGDKDLVVVLGKNGDAHLVRLKDGAKKLLFSLKVQTDSEQGLLGLAFHPKFEENRRFFLNYSPAGSGSYNRVAEWRWPKDGTPTEQKVLIDVADPYPNHNAGQLVFGPDGFLYIGFGDGGWMNDPEESGQDLKQLLGKMVRIDVDQAGEKQRPYGIPKDNPFVATKGARPEIWAYGLRNPWRYTFSTTGRLVVADVGQNAKEEVTYLSAGDNAGWKIFEGENCREPDSGCKKSGLRFPITTYGRDDGISITGGYEVLDGSIAPLKGLYVFGDYAFGRIWAIKLPAGDGKIDRDQFHTLGRYPLTISTFGRDHDGKVYVGAFDVGAIYRIDPA
jgi:glucose/arabinose dehydrogenase